jgi:hypothetical protein
MHSPLMNRAQRAVAEFTYPKEPDTSPEDVLTSWSTLATGPGLYSSQDSVLPRFLELLPGEQYSAVVVRVVQAWWAQNKHKKANQLPATWAGVLKELHLLRKAKRLCRSQAWPRCPASHAATQAAAPGSATL